jgi:hypothetical protein
MWVYNYIQSICCHRMDLTIVFFWEKFWLCSAESIYCPIWLIKRKYINYRSIVNFYIENFPSVFPFPCDNWIHINSIFRTIFMSVYDQNSEQTSPKISLIQLPHQHALNCCSEINGSLQFTNQHFWVFAKSLTDSLTSLRIVEIWSTLTSIP